MADTKSIIDLFNNLKHITEGSTLEGFHMIMDTETSMKNLFNNMDVDTAITAFYKLGVEGENLKEILKRCGMETEDIDEKLNTLGSSGTKGVSKISAAYAGLAAKLGTTTATLTKVIAGFSAAAVAIGLASVVYQEYKRVQEEQLQAAQANAEAYAESTKAIDAYKSETASLIKSIESGTLSSDELYNARLRLVEIEDELVSSFGAEADSMSLLTAKANEAADAYN